MSTARKTTATVLSLGALAGAATFATVSPWLSAMTIRAAFTRSAHNTSLEMERHTPTGGVDAGLNVRYGGTLPSAMLDVFTPTGNAQPLATIVWIHGGAWLSGTKNDVRPYLRALASRGYTVIGVEYPLAPEYAYPLALHEINTALGYLTDESARLRIDPARLIIAGDSAGAQLASQLITAITDPAYATRIGLFPRVRPDQLVGAILHCGIYDLPALSQLSGVTGWGLKTALWSYLDTRKWADTAEALAMSTINFVTPQFVPTFISGGNADGLTPTQSRAMASRLASLGVDVTELFWDDDHAAALPHEYQFHLDLKEAHIALDETAGWLSRVTGSAPPIAPVDSATPGDIS